jgi:UDP-N-acetyl-D-glucosamine/UDP-N-acetyl-D-galactosamine dehydrogenase
MINVSTDNPTVGVVGLGYVGLPLAIEFAKRYNTIGYDSCAEKVAAYRQYRDPAGEVGNGELRAATRLELTTDPSRLRSADFLIVAVPTPVDDAHTPDLSMLLNASVIVGENMKAGAIVVYESTVYPGATEDDCVPVLEEASGFQWKRDFHVGYSPERVNPGDKDRTITKIVKVVSGDDEATLKVVSELYASVIKAGVHRASSIRVAEAAKVIENTQRDLNIALMNELAVIFERMGIDTTEVLRAAGTKWNFLSFRPGLVGGHCIGIDPYYLTHKAEMLGYHPEVILAGRRINDNMAAWTAQQVVKQMIRAGSLIKGAKVNVLGLTFKENCMDLRNSKVADLVVELKDYGCDVYVHDPMAVEADARHEYGIALESWERLPKADAIVAAVAHKQYLDMPLKMLQTKIKTGGIFFDLQSAYSQQSFIENGFRVWRL